MRNKPKSALATLLDDINSSNKTSEIDLPVNVDMPNIDSQEINENNINNSQSIIHNLEGDTSTKEKLININPNDCHLWRFADRPDDELGDIAELANSMRQSGQQEPILIRKNTQETKHRYEIIFGNRRWQAAKLLNLPLLAIIKEVTDPQAALYQKEENEKRKDLSDYARAKSYKRQIEAGIFKSESELSKSLGISKRTLNDIMAYIRIPQEIIDAIPNYKDISRITAVKLSVLSKNKELHDKLIELGPKIGKKLITSSNVERIIDKSLTEGKKIKYLNITNSNGIIVAKLKKQTNGEIVISINNLIAKEININDLSKKISKLFDNPN